MNTIQDTFLKIQIICIDKNETQKLASMIFINTGNDVFIKEILNVYDNEVVVSLRDKSAHSIILKDNIQAEKFVDFMQSVIEFRYKIIKATIFHDTLEITKELLIKGSS
jgi:hypothetical protein